MPDCGSQCYLCDLPIRFDTYDGCAHGCQYCFVYRKKDIAKIRANETVATLAKFIHGERTDTTNWCDWNIPLHWGGMSDPFQPLERQLHISLECLKLFAKTKYPFVVSTKSVLPTEEPYYSLFKECNCVFQVSMVAPTLVSRLEKGAPSYEERLEMVRKMSKACQRVVVRCQPYVLELHNEILAQIKRIAEAGAYGIVFEALKMQSKFRGLVKIGADYVYPRKILLKKWQELKEECHKYGLVFLSGENRFRNMGDSLTCCGSEGLEGFRGNTYNFNHMIFDKKGVVCPEAAKKPGTSMCFKAVKQDTVGGSAFKKLSFEDVMDTVVRDSRFVNIYLGRENE